jgi:hypothetical protein
MIPESVVSIGNESFMECSRLAGVSIPGRLTNIGDGAFSYCTNLTSVYFMGDAPSGGLGSFSLGPATLYYLPGTTGWESFDVWERLGRRAILWNPQIQTSNANFGVQTNNFGFNIVGTADIPVLVEGCSNLANLTWSSLEFLTLTNGLVYFSDPQWTNYPARFYLWVARTPSRLPT